MEVLIEPTEDQDGLKGKKCSNCEVYVCNLLEKIEITSLPNTTEYWVGEGFDATEMVVKATYTNGNSKTVSGYTTNGNEVIKTVGQNKEVTVSYTEYGITKTVSFFINVSIPDPSVVSILSSKTTGTNGTDSKYVLFGEWPQTIKADNVTVDETKSKVVGQFTYYLGSDGSYYVKCKGNPCGTDSQFKYSNGKQIEKNYKYFKVEPIKWRVLNKNFDGKGNALLLAEGALTANIPYYESSSNHRNGSYPNNYKDSQIRAYLNGISYDAASSSDEDKWLNKGFLQSAFTTEAQGKIVVTNVDNSAASTTDKGGNITKATDYACSNTDDKIFLLSEYEVTKYSKEAYDSYGQGNSRIRMPTDYALANHCYKHSNSNYGCHWWLRSPSYRNDNYAREVDDDGDASNIDNVDSSYYGVVPALVVPLQ